MIEEEKRRWRRRPAQTGAARALTQIVKKGDRTPSSRRWLERQLNDPYVHRAKAEGWRSRAAFKLLELDARFAFLRRNMAVVDLGAAPGGWAQAALRHGVGPLVGIDLLPIEPMEGAQFLEMDIEAEEAEGLLLAALGGRRPDLVLSDMAANTTGHKTTDQIRTGALAQVACEFALRTLAPNGALVAKVFQGGLDAGALAGLKRAFAHVRHAKPPASRAESSEIYLVAQGFRGAS